MRRKQKIEFGVCGVCNRSLPRARLIPCDEVRPSLAESLDGAHRDWRASGFICSDDLQTFRRHQLEEMIRRERGELTELDRSVLASLAKDETVSENVEDIYEEKADFGDRLADRMATFAGSWTFILAFAFVLALWMIVNTVHRVLTPFDPYPYILLNLVLSCIAAVQAPLIMMSQRRLEAKDRLRSENDYRINLKAELEIRHLHEKVDYHLLRQWQRLTEIQEMQLDLIEDIANRRR